MADMPISAMTAATAVADADLVPIVQSGVNKKAPVSLLKARTDLDYIPATRVLSSSTGNDVTLPLATRATPGLMGNSDKIAIDRLDTEIGQAATVTAHTDLVTYIGTVEARVAALEHSGDPIVADIHLTVDNYSGGFIRIIGADAVGKIDLALATTPGPGGAIYPALGDIPGGAAVWADFGGSLGHVKTAAGSDVLGSTLKEWIRRGSVLTTHKDNTDPAHPALVVDLIEDPTPAGSSLSLGNLNSVDDAVDTAPAGKVLGATATGAWGAVDAGSSITVLDGVTLNNLRERTFVIADGAAVDLNPANGSLQNWVLTGDRTPTVTNFQEGQSMKLRISGNFSVTWPAEVVFVSDTPGSDGSPPTGPGAGFLHLEMWKEQNTLYAGMPAYSAT